MTKLAAIKVSHESRFNAGAQFHVVHVISGLFFGGGQRVVADLMQGQCNHERLRASLVLLGDADTPLSKLAVHTIPYNGRYNHPRQFAFAAKHLRRLIKQERVRIVHSHGIDADFIAALAVVGTSTAHVVHFHTSPPIGRRKSWRAAVHRKALRLLTNRPSTQFIAVADAVRDSMSQYYGIPCNRIHTVRNGINTDRYCSNGRPRVAGGQALVFGTAARLGPGKGIEFLLHSTHQLNKEGLLLRVKIAGDGSRRRTFQQLSRDLGIGKYVEFVGHLDDMRSFYESIDVFVLPSLSEGLPLSVLEAMSMNCSVIATDVGGTAEALRHSVDGLVITPRSQSALTNAMRSMLKNGSMRDEMGRNGRQHVLRHFTTTRLIREVEAVYKSLILVPEKLVAHSADEQWCRRYEN